MAKSKRATGVRGPNSALTEFLRVEGITDGFRRRQQVQLTDSSETEQVVDQDVIDELINDLEPAATRTRTRATGGSRATEEANEDDDEEVLQIKAAGRRKRKIARGAASSSDPDDLDDADFSDGVGGSKFKKYGDDDHCVECGDVFPISVYSRYDKSRKGYLCEKCNDEFKKRERNARRNQLNARKKRKKMALALLDKAEVKVASLQDICIKKITSKIDDVEVLGDIGATNMNKISRILSRNRSLDSSTMTLFLNPDLKSLELWDCSNVDTDALNKIALYCPKLELLTLFMCGYLHNDNLKYYASNLTNLQELHLNGPFLISDVMWQEFFESENLHLARFEIRNTHRFGNDSLISLLENFGKQLTELKLSFLDGLNSAAIYELIPHYLETNNLTTLEISYPTHGDLVTDALLINILAITGETLTDLNVDGCTALTDEFLLEGVCKFCPNLTRLSMKLVDKVTNKGFAQAFQQYSAVNSGGLTTAILTKCSGLGDEAIHALLVHSSHTLLELSLNSVYNVSREFWQQIFTDDYSPSKRALKEAIEVAPPQRESEGDDNVDEIVEPPKYFLEVRLPLITTLDVGFVRSIDNMVLQMIGEFCPKLKILEVFGDNRCTSKAAVREGMLIIGRQSDCI